MHEAFANSAALQAAGITRDTPDPHDGFFERDETGALTGRVVEVSAVGQLMAGIPAPSDAALRFLLAESYAQFARAGYTTIGITGLVGRARDPLAILSDIARHDRTALNTALYLLPDQFDHGADLFTGADQTRAIRTVSGLKIWLDGSPFVGGAATAEPYADTRFNADVLGLPPGWRGPLAIGEDTALNLARQTHDQGLQMAFHAQGETAIDLALSVIETVQDDHPQPALHHRLEHLALITPDQMDKAIALDMTLGFFPDHIGYYGHRLADMFGEERAGRYMPIELARQQGAVVTIHGDHPASTIDSVRVMALPVHRLTRDGQRLGDRVEAEFALRMMTINAARQLQLDHQIGSLEPGKRADLVWFDTDPVSALETGNDFTARQTWLSGRPVDTRPGSLDRIGRMLAAAWGQITN